MVTVLEWIKENWQMIIPIGLLLILFSLSGNVTRTVRTAKEGLKESMTPLGFIILLGIAYIGYLIYLSIMETPP